MSFTEQTDPNAPVTPPPAEAPVIAPKVSGGIAPDVKLPGRKVFLTAPQLAEIKEEDILGGTVSDSGDAATRQRRGFDVILSRSTTCKQIRCSPADNTTQTKKQSANYHDYQQQTEQIYKTNWHRSVYTAKTVEHQAEQDLTAQTFP
jgi:Rieske Fe-S protein